MEKKLQENYTTLTTRYQLTLNLDLMTYIDKNDPVRLLSGILEGLNYTKLLSTYSENGRNSAVPPVILFKILVYAYMNRVYSSRDIHKLCRRDIHFMWLLNGFGIPSHNAINRFRKKRLRDGVLEDLFTQLVEILYQLDEVHFENIFIDGTKIEANANRYSFVWLRTIMTNEAKLHKKIEVLFTDIETEFHVKYRFDEKQPLRELEACIDVLTTRANDEGIVFVSGKGRRKTPLQRLLEKCREYAQRQKQYLEYQEVIGNQRTSCSKTDHDATFMRMKEDHMMNGQLKPGYNIQLGVEAEYIVGMDIFQKSTDTPTLIPFLEKLKVSYGDKQFKNIVADAGYESEENYQFLARNSYIPFIKPINYEQSKTRKYKKQIGKRENMLYDNENDRYQCANEQWLLPIETKIRTSKSGFKSEVTVYESQSCLNCPLREACSKAKSADTAKRVEVSKPFFAYRQESLENIKTDLGIVLRKNRSIQVEGAFGVMKHDYRFKRFLTRGKVEVGIEMLLLCFGYNVKKLHNKIKQKRLGHQLHSQNIA